MTVTWPLPPGSTLADPARPIVFTTERAATAVSVALGDRRVEERAYRDGAFVWPYLRSTKSGNTFTLVRDDGRPGWPADPKPFVDEEPAPTPIPTTFWSVLYERDLRTLPNQIIWSTLQNAYVAFTMDGQPWYAHGAALSLSLVSGTGLTGQVSGDMSGGNPYAGGRFGLKVYAMAGYDPNKHTAVQVRFKGAPASIAYGADLWSSTEGWGYGPGNNSTICTRNLSNIQSRHHGTVQNTLASTFLAEEDAGEWCFSVMATPFIKPSGSYKDRCLRTMLYQRNCTYPNWPSLEQMQAIDAYNGQGTVEGPDYKLGFYVGVGSGTVAFPPATHIRVLQKGVATL